MKTQNTNTRTATTATTPVVATAVPVTGGRRPVSAFGYVVSMLMLI